MIVRGTTPTHTFTLPVDESNVKRIRVIYSQGGEAVIKVDDGRVSVSGTTASVTLTQQETLSFQASKAVDIQLRVVTKGGDSLVSDPVRTFVGVCNDNEVLV